MSQPNLRIRPARAGEGETLTDLCFRSKASWGYPREFMEAWRPEITVTETYLARAPVWVLEVEQSIAGFASFSVPGEPPELIFLFIEPAHFHRGFGLALWKRVVEHARSLCLSQFEIVCDPYAEAFYLKQGAYRTSEKFFAVTNRTVPVLTYRLD